MTTKPILLNNSREQMSKTKYLAIFTCNVLLLSLFVVAFSMIGLVFLFFWLILNNQWEGVVTVNSTGGYPYVNTLNISRMDYNLLLGRFNIGLFSITNFLQYRTIAQAHFTKKLKILLQSNVIVLALVVFFIPFNFLFNYVNLPFTYYGVYANPKVEIRKL